MEGTEILRESVSFPLPTVGKEQFHGHRWFLTTRSENRFKSRKSCQPKKTVTFIRWIAAKWLRFGYVKLQMNCNQNVQQVCNGRDI